MYVMNLSDLPSKEIMPGYHGKLVHSQNMSIVFWTVEEGAEVPEHSHMNEQIMHVQEGRFEFTLDGDTKTYKANDIVVIPPHSPHSGKALTPCKLMDVFSPVREAYR
ncbi:Cupin domain-containing protein [Pseudozobellia thermophila]|uniref:Cupin domain-containing protein n=2 Tax=Pseudozobellia thermophila TaxID=192903 RepID=A0A1M6LU06_9FLAO|nr:Cupin domain-containing protein [Pseudozobellia thermophila]